MESNVDLRNDAGDSVPAMPNGKGHKDHGLSEAEMHKLENEALMKIVNMTSIVSMANPRGDVLDVNNLLCEVSQYDRDECLGRPHSMFRHPDMSKAVFKEMWATISRGNVFRGKIKNKKKDGSPYYVDAVVCPIMGKEGKPVKYLGVRYEITDQELERQNMKGVIDAIDQAYAYIEFDTTGNIYTANKNFLMATGYQLHEIQGKHHSMFVDPAVSSTPQYRKFWEDLANGSFFNDEYKRVAKDGSVIWLRAVYTPIKDEMGRVVKVIKIATDITAQRLEQEDLVYKVNKILDVVKAAMQGDLTQEVRTEGEKPIDSVCQSLCQFFEHLRKDVQSIAKSTDVLASSSEELSMIGQEMAGNAEETSAQSNLVSAAAEEVSQNIQTVAAGAEQLNASIKEIAKNTTDAARVATEALAVSEATNHSVLKLGESSTQIGQVVEVITTIAQQTKLLALNATIEAARAGEVGKGFAVVANEVKELAKETAKATEDISSKIIAIQSDTQDTVAAISKINEIMKAINDTQNTIASAVEEQAATTSEIGRNVSEAAKGAAEISENIMSVAQAAQNTAKGAMSSQTSAQQLAGMSTDLQRIVSRFKY